MKNKTIGLIVGFLLMSCLFACASGNQITQPQTMAGSVPFSRGVHLLDWFGWPGNVQELNFGKYEEQDFIFLKSLGVDVIRLPINMHYFTLGSPDYVLDPIFLKFLETAVDLAEKHQIYIILDNHSTGENHENVAPTNERTKEIVRKVWPQMAEHFKNRSEYVLYEIMNEPNGISARDWYNFQGEMIEAIRRIDQRHTIVVSGIDYSKIDSLITMTPYSDKNLIYTFHFYDPHFFTHQGNPDSQNLNDFDLTMLTGFSFPYDRTRMPQLSNELKGTWVEDYLRNNYPNDANKSALTRKFDQVTAWSRKHNVPVFLGEFAAGRNAPAEDRIRWVEFARNEMDKRNIPWTYFGYDDYWGFFNTWSGWGNLFPGDFNRDLNIDLVRALGFTPVPQQTGQKEPIRQGYTIYDDYLNRDHWAWHWGEGAVFKRYDSTAADGDYSIYLGNLRQGGFSIYFNNFVDLSYLAEQGYSLEFKVRTDSPVNLNVQFVTKEGDINWHRGYTIDRGQLQSGTWHTIRIPLGNMQDWGGWNQTAQRSANPPNKFSWTQVNQIDFSIDNPTNCAIWIDSIRFAAP